ncbi:MAG: thiamine biosynthesis lipoprotein ApbE [Acidimicrobiales bacterium]|nr:thiamine biosynthesis lipoprotein ApbE [Acidimicrobiales bacterium]
MEADVRFRAMGSDVHIVVHGPVELAELARELVEELEQRWSRFRPGSEVSRLNARAGRWTQVSPSTLELVERAIEGWQFTAGRFDPTVLGDVVRAGYDRSFEQLDHASDRALPDSSLQRGTIGIAVDHVEGAVYLPEGVGFDPGGLGKGLAADLVAARVVDEGAAGVLVNVGGDLRSLGYAPAGDDWTVDIDPAATGHPIATVALEEGAVATSTTLRRRWQAGGTPMHHLIDPATGRPAQRGIVAATVLAARGWQAEVLAKAALVAGVTDGLRLVEDAGADGILVDDLGGLHPTAGFARFGQVSRSAPGVAGPLPLDAGVDRS